MSKTIILENENKIIDLEKRLYHAVIDLINGVIKRFPLQKITANEQTSPIVIPFPEIPNSFFVYYPPNSDHYVEKWDGKKKHCVILHGKIFESVENKVYIENEEFDIESGKTYDPYTKDEMCLAFVKIIE